MPPNAKVSLRYGMWFSYVCVDDRHDDDDKRRDEESSDEDDNDMEGQGHKEKHHKKCDCEKISSKCFFEFYDMFGLVTVTVDERRQDSVHKDAKGMLACAIIRPAK